MFGKIFTCNHKALKILKPSFGVLQSAQPSAQVFLVTISEKNAFGDFKGGNVVKPKTIDETWLWLAEIKQPSSFPAEVRMVAVQLGRNILQVSPGFVSEEWSHVLAWDLFVGRWVYLDGQRRGIFASHSVLFCNLIGPPGLVMHAITCLVLGKGLPEEPLEKGGLFDDELLVTPKLISKVTGGSEFWPQLCSFGPGHCRLMGQQVSGESSLEAKQAQSPRWCRDTQTDVPKANRETDSVRISRNFKARAGLCSGALPLGPDVLVTDINGSSAKVYWSINQAEEARKIHLELLLDQGAGGMSEVAFFEVGGSQSSWELPDGTLQRGSGPYQIQLVLESGPVDAPKLTKPSCSDFFWAAEAPGEVPVTLSEVECESFTICWSLPDDDGGVAIEAFEVRVQCNAKDEDRDNLTKVTHELVLDADARSSCFCGLQPGSGPHYVKVRARNKAQLWSARSELQVFTAYLAPEAPTELSARLLPGWARRLSTFSFGSESGDTDVVKLQFKPPSQTGGRPIEAYIIHAEEEISEASMEGDKPGPKMRALEVPASSLTTEEARRWFVWLVQDFPSAPGAGGGRGPGPGVLVRAAVFLAMSSVAALNRTQREKLQNFQQVTGAPQRLAMEFLRRLNWSLDQALDVFFQEGHSCGVQQEHLDAKKLEALFMKYASSEDQTIRPEGIEELCKDLQISALDPVTLVLAWHCRAKQMGIFTREEFTTGMQRLGCDELPKLRAKVADMRQALQDRAACKEVYAFTFQFALDQGTGHHLFRDPNFERLFSCLPVDMCIEFWKLLLPAHFALLETWISWVEQNVKNHVSKELGMEP
eukprot:s794_g11.t1